MRVICCSSGCCAIKHIRDFDYLPDVMTYYSACDGHDDDQSSVSPDLSRWEFIDEGGKIPAGDYFRLLVKQIKDRRPAGMITANLAAETSEEYCCEDCNGPRSEWEPGDFDSDQVDAWRPIFEELGFKETTFMNSNSGYRIHHFVLTYGEG